MNTIKPPPESFNLDTNSPIKARGNRAIIPIKIINEIPFQYLYQ